MQMTGLEKHFEYYYHNSVSQRFTIFTDGITKDEMQESVEFYMNMPLVLGAFEPLTSNQRQAFADAFVNYIWYKVNKE